MMSAGCHDDCALTAMCEHCCISSRSPSRTLCLQDAQKCYNDSILGALLDSSYR
jgi:hypothetical protein